MASEGAPLSLRQDGLYVVISLGKSKMKDRQAAGPPVSDHDAHDGFEWGIYWSKAPGTGHSFRYKETGGVWQFEHRSYPSESRAKNDPLEENERIIVALQIENMSENMANLLDDRLGPKEFQYSQPFRPRSASHGSSMTNGDDDQGREDRSRKWLGHALVMLNDMGFISLRDGTTSAALIENEALTRARQNIASSPIRRTVDTSENVIFDGKGPDSGAE
jgi:hypothetical protein